MPPLPNLLLALVVGSRGERGKRRRRGGGMKRGGWCGCLGRRGRGGEGGKALGRMIWWGELGEWILRVGMGRGGREEGWKGGRSVWGRRGRGGRRGGWERGSGRIYARLEIGERQVQRFEPSMVGEAWRRTSKLRILLRIVLSSYPYFCPHPVCRTPYIPQCSTRKVPPCHYAFTPQSILIDP